ncbi:hypothetical protein TorRG33x02_152920 [Trema orientale]|uniref:Uncharacterized protein n=1 Tax=Trema orientale TaxID=63057 RepID=A0A2P5ETM7_TREOI|nr:hypothetical protein TorRG33x02_152920 [Trema orientale]
MGMLSGNVQWFQLSRETRGKMWSQLPTQYRCFGVFGSDNSVESSQSHLEGSARVLQKATRIVLEIDSGSGILPKISAMIPSEI